jgi:short subunit fatty acids transporter
MIPPQLPAIEQKGNKHITVSTIKQHYQAAALRVIIIIIIIISCLIGLKKNEVGSLDTHDAAARIRRLMVSKRYYLRNLLERSNSKAKHFHRGQSHTV